MREFIMAAMPFVTFGIVLAIVCVYHIGKNRRKYRGGLEYEVFKMW